MIPSRLHPRFWSHVQVKSRNECWPWTAFRDKDGYGMYGYGGCGTSFRAHRIAYALTRGEIPKGRCVCHRCDNPPCCNPDHLFVATTAENNHDRARKGRNGDPGNTGFSRGAAQGERNRHAKLTEAQVLAIRRRVTAGEEQKQIAHSLGLDKGTVWRLVHGHTWKHLH